MIILALFVLGWLLWGGAFVIARSGPLPEGLFYVVLVMSILGGSMIGSALVQSAFLIAGVS